MGCTSSNSLKLFQLKNVQKYQNLIFQALSEMRKSQKVYIQKLKQQEKLIQNINKVGNVLHLYKNLSLKIEEDKTIWQQTIKQLENVSFQKTISKQEYLCKAAQKQANSIQLIDQNQISSKKYHPEYFYGLISEFCKLPHPKCQCSQIIKVQTKPRFQSQKQFQQNVKKLAQNVIISLLVDDGVKQRKSRKILLDKKWKSFGISVIQKTHCLITVMIFCTQKWLPKQKM